MRAPPLSPQTASGQLDFLKGDWNLVGADGVAAGESHIDVPLPGSMVAEQRKDANGVLPVWFFNSEEKGGWVQLFPGRSGALRAFYPQSAPGAWPLVLGTKVKLKDGRDGQFRLTLSHASDNESRRILEMSTDAGKTWSLVFDYKYVRATAR